MSYSLTMKNQHKTIKHFNAQNYYTNMFYSQESKLREKIALGEFFGPMKEETDAFIKQILQQGGVGLATAGHARNVLALTMAADNSCKNGTPVKL